MGTLLSIYLESCAGPNVMMQQVTQTQDKTLAACTAGRQKQPSCSQ